MLGKPSVQEPRVDSVINTSSIVDEEIHHWPLFPTEHVLLLLLAFHVARCAKREESGTRRTEYHGQYKGDMPHTGCLHLLSTQQETGAASRRAV